MPKNEKTPNTGEGVTAAINTTMTNEMTNEPIAKTRSQPPTVPAFHSLDDPDAWEPFQEVDERSEEGCEGQAQEASESGKRNHSNGRGKKPPRNKWKALWPALIGNW